MGNAQKEKEAALSGGNFWEGVAIGFVVSVANHALHGDPIDPKKKKAGAETSGDTRKYLYGSSEQSALEDFLFGPSYIQGGGGAMELLALGPAKGAKWLLKLFGARGTSVARLSTNGVKLTHQLASEAQMLQSGRTIISNLRSGPRLAKQYGGRASDWVKKSSSSFRKNGKTFETHWYQNVSTNQRVEFKTKLIKGW